MTSNLSPADVARVYWLEPLVPERMPDVATQMLADGHDAPSLRRVAGMVSCDPRAVREAFVKALQELGVWIPDEQTAGRLLAYDLAQDLQAGHASLAETAARIRRHWDFDEVIYPTLPPLLEEFVIMGWLHGVGEEYDANGGDSRFLRTAAALLQDDPSTPHRADPPA